jgi:exopolyphosphatase/guanosine-5'-triphosphate,3'-diphosphate pyrophosphatase
MATRLKNLPEQIVAFIDIGTNSIRLLLVQNNAPAGPGFNFRVITQQKETVRLGEGEFNNNYLTPEAMQRAVIVCRKFRDLANSYGAGEIIAVATSATRDAENQNEFLDLLRLQANLDVQVISGKEEARLIYLGVSSGVNLGNCNGFFIDIGGGSTELIIGNQGNYQYLDSLKLGAIRLTTLFLANESGTISSAKYTTIQHHVRHEAVQTLNKIRQFQIDVAFGSSGTIENLAEIASRMFFKRKLQRDDFLEYAHLKQVIGLLCSLPLEERRNVAGINPERADIIIGGAAIIDTLMQELNLSRIRISDRGLRDGLLIDYISRSENHELHRMSFREHSVSQLGQICNYDEFHANKVAELALELYDSAYVLGLHHFGLKERELLEYAALLHDIGSFLSYHNHQAHTYYLIRNADLLGFNQTEIAIIAATAYFHRKALPRRKNPEIAELDKQSQKAVTKLSLLLRIAESLDRSHTGIIKHAKFQFADFFEVRLEIEADQDCQLELWGLRNHEKAIAEVFEKKLTVKLGPSLDGNTSNLK